MRKYLEESLSSSPSARRPKDMFLQRLDPRVSAYDGGQGLPLDRRQLI